LRIFIENEQVPREIKAIPPSSPGPVLPVAIALTIPARSNLSIAFTCAVVIDGKRINWTQRHASGRQPWDCWTGRRRQ